MWVGEETPTEETTIGDEMPLTDPRTEQSPAEVCAGAGQHATWIEPVGTICVCRKGGSRAALFLLGGGRGLDHGLLPARIWAGRAVAIPARKLP